MNKNPLSFMSQNEFKHPYLKGQRYIGTVPCTYHLRFQLWPIPFSHNSPVLLAFKETSNLTDNIFYGTLHFPYYMSAYN